LCFYLIVYVIIVYCFQGLVKVQASMPPYSAAGAAPAGRPAVPMTSLSQQAYVSLCYDFPVSTVGTYLSLMVSLQAGK
jgi:hypothetical protein